MRNQGIKAAGEVMSATPGAPAGHASPPPGFLELARRCQLLHNKERTVNRLCSIIREQSGDHKDNSSEPINLIRSEIRSIFH